MPREPSLPSERAGGRVGGQSRSRGIPALPGAMRDAGCKGRGLPPCQRGPSPPASLPGSVRLPGLSAHLRGLKSLFLPRGGGARARMAPEAGKVRGFPGSDPASLIRCPWGPVAGGAGGGGEDARVGSFSPRSPGPVEQLAGLSRSRPCLPALFPSLRLRVGAGGQKERASRGSSAQAEGGKKNPPRIGSGAPASWSPRPSPAISEALRAQSAFPAAAKGPAPPASCSQWAPSLPVARPCCQLRGDAARDPGGPREPPGL